MREFECPRDGFVCYRPQDYVLLPDCPWCGGFARPTTKYTRFWSALRRLFRREIPERLNQPRNAA